MHGFLKGLAIIFLISTQTHAVQAQENLPEIIKKIKPSVVSILTYDKKGSTLGQGSGFFNSAEGNLITNRHVLRGVDSAKVKIADDRAFSIKDVLAEDIEGDLILVSTEVPKDIVHPLPISNSIPEVGERIVVIGSPLGFEETASDGIVSALRDMPTLKQAIQITASISPGSSGSPVVNMKGEVVGVAVFQMVKGQNLNFAVSGERVTNLKPKEKQTLAQWNRRVDQEFLSPANDLYTKGLNSLLLKDYKKALLYFKEAAKKDPNYAEAYRAIGWTYGKLSHYQEAIKAYRQAIRIKPDYAEAYYCMGLAYGLLKRFPEGIEAFKQAIHINPEDVDTYYCMGLAYGELARYEEAIETFKKATRISPDHAKAHYYLGVAYLNSGDTSSALKEYGILKNLDVKLADELFNLIYR